MCKDKVRCIPGQFLCKLTGGCVSLTAVCDGKQDCDDGSDEQQCRELPTSDDEIHVGCGVDEFSCDRGSVCLPWKHKCDGHFDCRGEEISFLGLISSLISHGSVCCIARTRKKRLVLLLYLYIYISIKYYLLTAYPSIQSEIICQIFFFAGIFLLTL